MVRNRFVQYQEIVYDIIGAAMEVHSTLGAGLLEAVYAESMHLELLDNGIDNNLEVEVPCYYKHHKLEKSYQADLMVGEVVVELKSVEELNSAHRAQLFNYLRLTQKNIGLLINFGGDSLEGERYIFDARLNDCCLVDRNMEPIPQNIGDFTFEYEDPYEDVIDLKK